MHHRILFNFLCPTKVLFFGLGCCITLLERASSITMFDDLKRELKSFAHFGDQALKEIKVGDPRLSLIQEVDINHCTKVYKATVAISSFVMMGKKNGPQVA